MTQQEALSILIDGIKKAYDRCGKNAYSFEEVGLLFTAIQAFVPPPPQPKEEKPKEEPQLPAQQHQISPHA